MGCPAGPTVKNTTLPCGVRFIYSIRTEESEIGIEKNRRKEEEGRGEGRGGEGEGVVTFCNFALKYIFGPLEPCY